MYFVYNRFIRKNVDFNKVAKLRSYLVQVKKRIYEKKQLNIRIIFINTSFICYISNFEYSFIE